MKIKIRQATPVDATEIAKVHVLTWQDSYRGLIEADYLEKMNVGESESKWLKRLSEAKDLVLVAEVGGKLVGFVHGRKSDGENGVAEAELCAVYVLKEFQHQGVGRLLFEELVQQMKKSGFHSMNLWVLAKNEVAKAFYMAMGAKLGKEKKSKKIGDKEYTVVEYFWTL